MDWMISRGPIQPRVWDSVAEFGSSPGAVLAVDGVFGVVCLDLGLLAVDGVAAVHEVLSGLALGQHWLRLGWVQCRDGGPAGRSGCGAAALPVLVTSHLLGKLSWSIWPDSPPAQAHLMLCQH